MHDTTGTNPARAQVTWDHGRCPPTTDMDVKKHFETFLMVVFDKYLHQCTFSWKMKQKEEEEDTVSLN